MFIRHVVRGRALQVHAARRRQGRAARRMRAAELERAALGRRRADQDLKEATMNKPVLPMSSLSLKLPTADRTIENYRLAASRTFPAKLEGTLNRVAFAAAHVVADPLADIDPWLDARDRLGPHHRVPRTPLGSRLRRRRSDGHRAARHGLDWPTLARTDPPLGARPRSRATRWCFPAPAPIISRRKTPKASTT